MIGRREFVGACGATLLLGGSTLAAHLVPVQEVAADARHVARLRSGQWALLVLDMQRDFLAPQGRLPVDQRQGLEVIRSVNTLLQVASRKDWPTGIVYNSYSPWDIRNLGRNFAAIRDSTGAMLDPRVNADVRCPRFAKSEPDAFSNPALGEFLRKSGASVVAIAGVFAEACITYTAMGAARAGFEPVVISDAVASASDTRRAVALAALMDNGVAVRTAYDVSAAG